MKNPAVRLLAQPCLAAMLAVVATIGAARASPASSLAGSLVEFIDEHCASCHDEVETKGNLDLTALTQVPRDARNFATWAKVFDRVQTGEMPPRKKPRPAPAALNTFLSELGGNLVTEDRARIAAEGRATRRRLNRHEFENALRDLLGTPWLQVKDSLPEDGVMNRFNKIGEALDVSHVQVSRYLATVEGALRQVASARALTPPASTIRYYAREQPRFTRAMHPPFYVNLTHWTAIPLLGYEAQPAVRRRRAPVTVGEADPVVREQEAVGVVHGTFEPFFPIFDRFKAPVDGRYRLRVKAYSIWVGAGYGQHWWIPDMDNVFAGRRPEPVTLYADNAFTSLRRIGSFDAPPQPAIAEFDTWLLAGETIRTDAARLVKFIPGDAKEVWKPPLAERDGQPGVAYNWLEVEGPLAGAAPGGGQDVLFGDLPVRPPAVAGGPAEVVTADPQADARRLLARFAAQAYRRPIDEAESVRFLPVIQRKLAAGAPFSDALLAGYAAVLCSPAFLYLEEKPGRLDAFAVAARLAFFLWNSPPDAELRALAATGQLASREVLRAQVNRLLDDPRSRRFTDAFLDYWLDLRRITANAPDATLYADYYLDDHLVESALEETQLFFRELIHGDLPARQLVAADFAMLNERLAVHYGLWATPAADPGDPAAPDGDAKAKGNPERNLSREQLAGLPLPEKRRPLVEGVALRRVALPAGSVRGGMLTQASVLAVTANGTTTSPVLRGAWIMERLLGQPSPPPPPVAAVEPDLRGLTTIREQLAQHRDQASCASCHAQIDPPGFALESFDVMGGWRDHYRAVANNRAERERGLGKNGIPFLFRSGLPVDSSGEMVDGRHFADIRGFKQILASDEEQIARNLARQFTIFATGAPIGFSDRDAIEHILRQAQPSGYGVRALIHELVQSDLFLEK